jgi:hypothetical protein
LYFSASEPHLGQRILLVNFIYVYHRLLTIKDFNKHYS